MIYFQLRDHDMYTKQQRLGTLQVVDGGLIQAKQGWRHKQRFLEQYELIFVTKGTLYLTVGKKAITLSENQLLILPPFQTLQGSHTSMCEVAFFWVDFHTDHAQALNMPPLMQSQTILHPNRLMPMLIMLCETFTMNCDQQDIQEAIIMLILYSAEKCYKMNESVRNYPNDILAYIEAHLSEPLTTQIVASALNYHKDYVCRVIHKLTGMPLKEYINRRKMDLSRSLLRTSTYSITEISNFLGYEDSNLFTKFFSYHQGVSPTVYRKNIK